MTRVIGFTGTQEGMTDHQKISVRAWFRETEVEYLHHGDCVGADAQAHEIAQDMGMVITIHPPTDVIRRARCWSEDIRKPKPYLDRNLDIVLESDELLACPKGFVEELRSGTWATIRYARKHHRRVIIVWPDGLIDLGV